MCNGYRIMAYRKDAKERFVCVNLTFPPHVFEYLQGHSNMSGFVSDLLEREMGTETVYCEKGHPMLKSSRAILDETRGKGFCPECERLRKEFTQSMRGDV